MNDESYSMVSECVDSYCAKVQPDGGLSITIEVPKRFRSLWLVKLSQLKTNEVEIAEYEKE